MKQVHDRIYVGNLSDCAPQAKDMGVVHACKTPCHQTAVGYEGSLPSDHEHYLMLKRDSDLFLNMIDPPVPLFKLETFKRFLTFASSHYYQGRSVLIHCNQGESRAPSLALVLLADMRIIPNESFIAAEREFSKLYLNYKPGKGIQRFLSDNWDTVL